MTARSRFSCDRNASSISLLPAGFCFLLFLKMKDLHRVKHDKDLGRAPILDNFQKDNGLADREFIRNYHLPGRFDITIF